MDGASETEIPYWLEQWDSGAQQAKVWVKVPSVPASGSSTIYLYYGNPTASSASNGNATFVFFDDFEDGVISSPWNKAQHIATITEANGHLEAAECGQYGTQYCNEGYAYVDLSAQGFDINAPFRIRFKMWDAEDNEGGESGGWALSSSVPSPGTNAMRGSTNLLLFHVGDANNRLMTELPEGWSLWDRGTQVHPSGLGTSGGWFEGEFRRDPSGNILWYFEGELKATTAAPSWSSVYFVFGEWDTDQSQDATYLDNLIVSKHTEPEPTAAVGAEEIQPSGTLVWLPGTPLPVPTNGDGVVTCNGYIYRIGGSARNGPTADVYYAPINADGSIGAWQATTPYPRTTEYMPAVCYNGRIYVISGHHTGWYHRDVYYAQLNPDGSISQWVRTTDFPTGNHNHSAVAYNGYIYVVGGNDDNCNNPALNTVYSAQINPDGSLGAWVSTTPLPTDRELGALVVYNNRLYSIGGVHYTGSSHYCGYETDDRVFYAPILGNGQLGSWVQTVSLPRPINGHIAQVTSDGQIYVVGGSKWEDWTVVYNSVYVSSISPDGTLGSWANETAYPIPVWRAGSAIWNDSLYVVGGVNVTGNLDDVYYTAPTSPPSQFTLTVTKAGTGSGTVISNPPGIDCGLDCSASFSSGTPVMLTATPDANSVFAGWSGDPDCSDGSVTMDADKNCIPTFNLAAPTINILIPTGASPIYVKQGGSFDVSFTTDQAGSYEIKVNGTSCGTGAADAGTNSKTCTLPNPFAEGIKNLTVEVMGTGGTGSDTETGAVLVDNTPPTITLDSRSPAPNSYGWNNSDVTITWSCTDPTSGGVSSGVATPPVSPQVFSSEGAGQVSNASCTDNAGNTANASELNINIDKTAPNDPSNVQSTSHEPGKPTRVQVITMAWQPGSDALSGVLGYRGVFDTSSENTCPTPGLGFPLPPNSTGTSSGSLADGTWYFHICTSDRAGNTTGTVTFPSIPPGFVIDTTAPASLRLIAPNSGEIIAANRPYTIRWELCTDANLGEKPIALYYSTDGGATYPNIITTETENDGSYDWLTPNINNGTMRVKVLCADRAGNQTSDTSDGNFTLTTTPELASKENSNAQLGQQQHNFFVGQQIKYTVVLTNNSTSSTVRDDPDRHEFVDQITDPALQPLPRPLTVNCTIPPCGTIGYDPQTQTFFWNGAIPPTGSVTLTYRVRAVGHPDLDEDAHRACNQGVLYVDTDGDGVNETSVLTKDPTPLPGLPPGDTRTCVLIVRRPDRGRGREPLQVLGLETLRLHAPEAIWFGVLGTGVKEINVQVFSLAGRQVYASGWVENGLEWQLQNMDGKRVANGVYLYVVRVRGYDGQEYVSEIRKLVILR